MEKLELSQSPTFTKKAADVLLLAARKAISSFSFDDTISLQPWFLRGARAFFNETEAKAASPCGDRDFF
ncbi:MAG: hypothetical protein WC913_02810 [Desulfuromonas sp.]|jgi:hypothetical protein